MSTPSPSAPRSRCGGRWATVCALAAAACTWAFLPQGQARASSLEDIRQLESLINAAGTETVVSSRCPPNHAGYFEQDNGRVNRLVICRRQVDLGDVDAVWEVMAHEATHLMQACQGGAVIADAQMPRTYRELQSLAPHYAKLISAAYGSDEQRLEAEAFWMELQTPQSVIERFRQSCDLRLRQMALRRQLPALVARPLPP